MRELNLANCHSQSLAIRDRLLDPVHLGLQQHQGQCSAGCGPHGASNAWGGYIDVYRGHFGGILTNIFQAFPRAMFSVNWEKFIVSDQEFSALKSQIGTARNIHINYLDHDTLDSLYVMVLPDGSMTIPSGANYLSFGPFLNVTDFEHVF